MTTLAGTAGIFGSTDGTGPAAQFSGLNGVAVDGDGMVYVADSSNNTVRKITPLGVVTTVVGVPGSGGVALGVLSGSLNYPVGVAAMPGPSVSLVISTSGENAILRADLP